jgi:hypothetical protein
MRVLLIANNPDVPPIVGDYDLYVHFNHAIHLDKVPLEKSIVCSRECWAVQKMQSFQYSATYGNKLYKIPAPDKQIWALGWEKVVRQVDATRKLIPLDGVPYPNGSPTSGYAAIHYFLNNGDEVFLSGFNLKVASYYRSTKLHKPDWEIEETQKMLQQGVIRRQFGE